MIKPKSHNLDGDPPRFLRNGEVLTLDGRELCRMRLEREMSLRAMAAAIGCGRGALDQWEHGTSVPNGINLERLRRYFGAELSRALKGEVKQ
jgi:transcriptional regulator with XRE-family HTH domain